MLPPRTTALFRWMRCALSRPVGAAPSSRSANTDEVANLRLAVAREIADRQRLEQELRRSEAQFAALFDNAPTSISLRDETGRFIQINSRFEEWFGISRERAIGRTVAELYGTPPAEAVDKTIREVIATRETRTFEFTARLQDGVTHNFVATAFPIPGPAPDSILVCSVIIDMTEQRQLETRLRYSERLKAIGQFSSGIAHDFNNLLAVILGNADLLLAAKVDDQRLAAIIRSAERGRELTHLLLAYSRKQELNPVPVDLHRLVLGIEDMLRRTLGEKIELKISHDSDSWPASADPSRVEDALIHLAINAHDAMPDGGILTIAIANRYLDAGYATQNQIEEVMSGDYVELAISDTGSGMSPVVIERAFEPFFTTKDIGKGSGLGLSMVYGFAKQSGGHIKIDSEVGHGTTVRLYLRRDLSGTALAPAQSGSADAAPRAKPGETILLVEDDAEVRALATNILADFGYTVIEAADGPAAIAAFDRAARVDLLLTDMILPKGMAGNAIADALRRKARPPKVLYMSGYSANVIARNGVLEEGANLIGKPFRRAELARAVRAALDGPRANP
ncbi:MAG: PAS domain S-box protein [Alphaproteobacteria bacterium]|nr:PAS domain S-box protein [Alphaproteobacteria bacterium]